MAGLGIFVKLDKEEFIGKEALATQKAEGVAKKLIGIELADKAIPRHGYAVLKDGEPIGEVTTGYHTISTDKSAHRQPLCQTRHRAGYPNPQEGFPRQGGKKTFLRETLQEIIVITK